MRTFFLLVALLFGATNISQAQEVSVLTSVKNNYLGVMGGLFHSDPVVQSQLVANHGNMTLIIWHSAGITSEFAPMWSDFDDEVDLIGIWSSSLGSFSTHLGAGYFKLVRDAASLDGDMTTAFGGIARTFDLGGPTVSPFIKVELYRPSRGKTPEGGALLYQGVSISGSVLWGAPLTLEISSLYDNGMLGGDKSWHIQQRLNVTQSLSSRISVYLDAFRSAPITDISDGRESQLQYGLGFSVKL